MVNDFSDFQYVRWEYLDQGVRFGDGRTMKKSFPHYFCPVEKKSRLVYISHRNWTQIPGRADPEKDAFVEFTAVASRLRTRFHGFVLWETNLSYGDKIPDEDSWKHFRFVVKHCFVYLASPYGIVHERSWLRYEAVRALMCQRLILNRNSRDLVQRIGTRPSLKLVEEFVKDAHIWYPEDRELLNKFLHKEFTPESFAYDFKLIEIAKQIPLEVNEVTGWNKIKAKGIKEQDLNKKRVLMVSHKWETLEHPDDDQSSQLKEIVKYLKDKRTEFDYLFYDFKCLDQSMPTESLMRVNHLFAECPCLCLTNERYLQSSWCLFELCINSLNRGDPEKVGIVDHHIFTWLKDAWLVRQMGYAHTLETSVVVLDLPKDNLHLKSQVRTLFLSESTTMTNRSDETIMLNLLDKLI